MIDNDGVADAVPNQQTPLYKKSPFQPYPKYVHILSIWKLYNQDYDVGDVIYDGAGLYRSAAVFPRFIR